MGPRPPAVAGRRELGAQPNKGPVWLSQAGLRRLSSLLVRQRRVKEQGSKHGACRAGAVSLELRRAAKAEEHFGAWAAEAKEPRRVGALSVEDHGAEATEVESDDGQ